MNIIDVFSYYNSKLNVYAYYPRRLLYYSILNKKYTKYYSINRTVVINIKQSFFYMIIGRFKTGSVDATSIYNGFSTPCNVISY